MSTPEAQPDPLLELAAAEAADNPEPEQPQPDVQVEPDSEPADERPWEADGFKSPEAAYQAWKNASQKITEQGQELGQLRQFQREVSQQMQQMQQPQAQAQPQTLSDGTPYYDLGQLQQWVENGDMTEFHANAIWADQQAKLHAEQMVEAVVAQRLAPIEAANMNRGAQDALDELNVALGDDVVARHAELIGKLITEDRAHYAHPQHGRRRLLEAVKSAEWDYQSGGQQERPRDSNGRFAPADTYVEGGSSAQPNVRPGGTRLDPDEQELISSLVPQRAVDEAGIPIPWAR